MAEDTSAAPPIQSVTSAPDFERVADFVSLYANNVQVESTAWDATLLFGQFDSRPRSNTVKQRASVTMAWAEMKAVCNVLLTNLAFYESFNGAIPMPKGMKPEPFTIPRAQEDPALKALQERIEKIRELIFGEV